MPHLTTVLNDIREVISKTQQLTHAAELAEATQIETAQELDDALGNAIGATERLTTLSDAVTEVIGDNEYAASADTLHTHLTAAREAAQNLVHRLRDLDDAETALRSELETNE